MLKIAVFICIGAGLLACSSVSEIRVESERIEVNESYGTARVIDSIVQPYRIELQAEMEVVVAHANNDFIAGKPNGPLNNWSCDILLDNQTEFCQGKTTMCLLNVGALRNPISKGDVTVGDIYRLMPFDNLVVWVEMPMSALSEVEAYLQKRNGEPVGGVRVKDGKIHFLNAEEGNETFWILTSDYLMNGGDYMSFFEQRIQEKYTGDLLRDVMLTEAQKQGELIFNNEERIQF